MRLRTLSRLASSLLLLLLIAGAFAQENPMPMGVLTSKTMLANRMDVRAALGLTFEQSAKIQESIGQMEGVNVSQSGAGSTFASFDSANKSIFTDEQWAKLTQLWIQFEGAFTLQDFTIAESLKISPEAREKIGQMASEYRQWWGGQVARIKKPSDLKRIRDTARKVSEKMLGLLDKDQKKRFLEMQGPKFKFTS
jgi:hypothetical protein